MRFFLFLLFLFAPFFPLQASAASLLPGDGFEQGLEPWTTFVARESKEANCAVGLTADSPHSGQQALRLTSTAFARQAVIAKGSLLPVKSGERYRVTAWVRAEEGTTVQPGTPGVLIRLTLRDAAGEDIYGGHYFIGLGNWVALGRIPPSSSTVPTSWTKIEAVVEIPEGAARCQPSFFVWSARGALVFDDLAFERVPDSTTLTALAPTSSPSGRDVPKPSSPPATELLTADIQRELFGALDLDLPSLNSVKAAFAQNDLAAATRLYATYLRTRPFKTWYLDPFDPKQPDLDHKYRAERADNAVIGRITPSGLAELWHTFPGNVIDWYRNETRYRPGMAFNQEWQFQLCRMSFWGDMADAYRATGDEKYPRAWVTQFRSFIAQCPAPDEVQNRLDSAWRTIECGIRMRDSWPRSFQAFLLSPSVTDEDIVLYAYSNIEHARYLEKFPSDWGNWLTMEMCGLHTIGTVFPEFKDAARWRSFAIKAIEGSIARQFLPDGAQYEGAPGYHIVALDENGMAIPRLARATGRLDEVPADYIASLEKGYDYLLFFMTPDRSAPRFNDSWPITWLSRVFQNGLLFFPGRDDWRWIATDGAEGHPSATTSHAFPYVGYYAMRSGWGTDANYLAFDAGPLGYAHWHQDKLNIALWSYGREILFDSGGGSYENSKWRKYSADTFSHNTVLVDGMPQRRLMRESDDNVSRVPNDVVWECTTDHDFTVGTYDGAYSNVSMWDDAQPTGPATHIRRVFFAKPDVFIVADTLIPDDEAEHTYQARWHLLPTEISEDAATQSVTTVESGKSNLAVIPLRTAGLDVRTASAQTEPEMLGWNVRKDMDPQYVPCTSVLHTIKGSGTQTFITLLLPLKIGEANPVRAVEPSGENTIRVSMTDDRTLIVTVAPDPKGAITVTRQP